MKDIPIPYERKETNGDMIEFHSHGRIIGFIHKYESLFSQGEVKLIRYQDEKTNTYTSIHIWEGIWYIKTFIGTMYNGRDLIEYKDSNGNWWSKKLMPDTPYPNITIGIMPII